MYSVKLSYEITLMHLLTIVIFDDSVKIQRTFFLIAIANDREITQKKQRPQVQTLMISKWLFFVKTISGNRPKITLYYNVK